MSKFGPINDREAEVFSATGLITRIQYEIEKELKRRNLSQKDLAERLGVTPARVNQMLNDNGNMTLRTLGRISHVLELKLEFSTDGRGAKKRVADTTAGGNEVAIGKTQNGFHPHPILIRNSKYHDDSVRRVMAILRHAHTSSKAIDADNENGFARVSEISEKAFA